MNTMRIASRVLLPLWVALGWLGPASAQSTNPFTAGIDACDNAGVAPARPRLPSYDLRTGMVDIPLVFAPGFGWYRASLEPAASPGSFRLRELVPSCEAHPSPAAYLASRAEVYLPELEAIGDAGVAGKYDVTLRFDGARGLFEATRIWDFVPGQGSAPSASAGAALRARRMPLAAAAPAATEEAVLLEHPTGPYAVGDRIPLSRISGARIGNPEAGCAARHLHGTAVIDGSGPYSDPNPPGCGHGVIVTVESGAPTSVVTTPVPAGTEYCGPDMTTAFFGRLRRMAQRLAALPDNERGVFDGTMFLARNGQNMDFAVGAVRNPQGDAVCPTQACTGTGHTSTITLCGRCMVSHIDNDIQYGFVARSLGVPWSVQLTGGQAWDFLNLSIDPTWSNAAYWFGNSLADKLAANPAATSAELCGLLDERVRIGLALLPNVSELIAAGLADFGKQNCTPCPHGCPEPLVNKDFGTTGWFLDSGTQPPPP